MSTRTLQDQVNTLLNKSVILPKVSGVPSPDVETASIVESLALAMMLQPKAAYYAYYLARNGIVASINSEVAAIEVLKADIADLGNVTYAIKNTDDLRRAQAAMLQLSAQKQMSSESGVFDRYSIAVDDFLNRQLAKNIKRPNSTEMTRPGEEAGSVLPTDLTTLKDAHSDFLDRLYSMAVGISNFINTPFSSIVGTNAVYRTKADLDSLIEELDADESGSQSRDAAVRLIAGRASVRMVGGQVDLRAPVIDSVIYLPPDQQLTGKSVATPVIATTAAGPFTMATGGSLSVTVDGQTVTTSALNQAGNAAAVLGTQTTFPVSVPANYHLFLRLEAVAGLTWVGPVASTSGPTDQGTYSEGTLGGDWLLGNGVYYKTLKVTLNSGYAPTVPAEVPPGGPTDQPRTLAEVLSAITSTLGAYGSAVEFVGSGSGRILIVASEPKLAKINIASSAIVMETQSNGTAVDTDKATIYINRIYTNSFHASLGFVEGQLGVAGNTPASRIQDALAIVFPSIVTNVLNTDDSITMTSLVTTPGVSMSLSGTWVASLGLASSYFAMSPSVTLQGVSGVVSPTGLMDFGDVLTASTGQSAISDLTADTFELSTPLRTFEGNITVTSALYITAEAIDSVVQSFLVDWVYGTFATDLSALDKVIAVLIGSPTSPRRSEAIALLDSLKTQLLALQTSITGTTTTLPTNSASKEKAVINNVSAIFTERGFDRALDLLSRCKLQELFELDWQTASYGGNLMKAAEDIARADVTFPNTIKDEGFEIKGQRKRLP